MFLNLQPFGGAGYNFVFISVACGLAFGSRVKQGAARISVFSPIFARLFPGKVSPRGVSRLLAGPYIGGIGAHGGQTGDMPASALRGAAASRLRARAA